MSERVLSLKNITKLYPGVTALSDVSLDFYAGEVHAIVGENGAGKSTLMKIIAGAISADAGTLEFSDGIVYHAMTPHHAKQYNVEIIYQEFNLVDSLSVAENICFGEKHGKFVNYKYMRGMARKAFDLFGVDISPNDSVFELPSSKKQIVEISRAIFRNAKILIMDEPSAPLSKAEVEKMFRVIRQLKEDGTCIIYISHRLDEIFDISDRTTVLRDGKFITTIQTKETSRQQLINLMVGRELVESFPEREKPGSEVCLEVQDICGNGISHVSFKLHKGEILGLAGLVGAGRTELARAIYGADKRSSGDIFINSRAVNTKSPSKAIEAGIGMVPEDRKLHGCILSKDIETNITLSCLKRISKFGFISLKEQNDITERYIKKLGIKTPSAEQRVGNLSGGNQQKVVIAKTLAAECNIFIFDEPTRGIDVRAKQEIYKLMAEIVSEGNAILMISSEMEELLGMSDRVIVLHEGEIQGELEAGEYQQEKILELAFGVQK